MLFARIKKFLKKPFVQKKISVRFHLWHALAKIPYLVVPVWFCVSPGKKIRFWWSYLSPNLESDKRIFDYLGPDMRELRFLYRMLKPGMCFVDIGAHHGIYTVIAGKKLRNAGRIIAFEPSLRERRRIKFHLLLNCIFNAIVEPYAVSFRNGRANFFLVLRGLTTMSGLKKLPKVLDPIKEVMVDTIILDGYCKEKGIKQIDILKVDTEGAELDVFKGAQDILITHRPLIICEVLDTTTKPYGYSGREIIAYLQRYNYEWLEFQDDDTLIPHNIKAGYPESEDYHFNYLAVPKDKLFLVKELIKK